MSTHSAARGSAHRGAKKAPARGAAAANSKRFHARAEEEERGRRASHRQQQEEDEEEEDDDNDDDDDDTPAFMPTTARHGLTLDMIATSTSQSSNKLNSRALQAQRTPKNTPRPDPATAAAAKKRKRDTAAIEAAAEEEAEEAEESAATSASFSASASAVEPASSGVAMPAFAPAATAVGALFSDVTPSLDADILHVLHTAFGFRRMTPVQQQTIPTFLKKDVAVQSYTGSGKTLSFVVPMLQTLITKFTSPSDGVLSIEPHTVAAIILSPTRELATQICSVIAPFVHGGEHASSRLQQFRLAQFIGGSAMSTVELDFTKSGGNIVVATPGRLNSTMGKLASFHTKDLRVLILDEADRLLDEGFEQDITDILRKLPKQRRTGLFSATQTRQVKELRRAGLQEKFAKIDVLLEWKKKREEGAAGATQESASRTQMTPTTLQNYYTLVRTEHKLSLLVDFLCAHAHEKVIIFFLTGDQVDYFSRLLVRLRALQTRGLHKKLYALRGGKQGMDQNKRNAQLQSFTKETSGGILIATDVAARGIDVPDVDWIVQYDPPKDPSVFVHRIGRTARMGKSGSAIVYLTPEERAYVDLVQNLNVPISLRPVNEEAFESHHSWKSDSDIADIVKAMEEGKTATVAIQAANKKHKNQPTEKKAASGDAATPAPSSIRSVLREVKYLALEDRFLMDKAQKAYTSFIDGYKQHVMTHALNFAKLPFGEVALGMGLLYLPKMPDIKHLTAMIKYDRVPIKPHFIKFKDAKLQQEHDKREAAIHEKNQQEQLERERKYNERQKKLAAAGPKRKKKAHQVIRDEWEELQNENRLLKKLKQGKMTKKEFEIAVGERKRNGQEKSNLSDSDGDFDDSDDDDGPPRKKAKGGKPADSDSDMSDDSEDE